MSPRSEEFMAMARERLAIARITLDAGFPTGAVSSSYYGMLNAARAALSEEERNSKTHSGTWALFHETFVASGRFDEGLHAAARRTQRQREAADYDALPVPQEEAERVVELAERFVAAVERLTEAQ